jgi:hypothetical protein
MESDGKDAYAQCTWLVVFAGCEYDVYLDYAIFSCTPRSDVYLEKDLPNLL